MARVSKKTPDTLTKICDAIAEGSEKGIACERAGVAYRTFAEWVQEDPSVASRVAAAEAKGQERYLSTVLSYAGAKSDWKGPAWVLEKLYPKKFGTRAVIAHEGEVSLNHKFDLSKLSVDELATMRALLKKASG